MPMAVLLSVSFSSGRRQGYNFIHPYCMSILTLCPSFPSVHPYHSVCLRSSHFQKKGSIGRRRETPLISHSLQPGTSVELQLSTVWVALSFLYRGMRWRGRCVIPWGPVSGPCWTGIMQKAAVILGAKPSIFSQAVMSHQIIQSLKIITHWGFPGWASRKWDLCGCLVTGRSLSQCWLVLIWPEDMGNWEGSLQGY